MEKTCNFFPSMNTFFFSTYIFSFFCFFLFFFFHKHISPTFTETLTHTEQQTNKQMEVCASCNEPILDGNVLRAFGMTWHPTHLCCKVCLKDFSDGSKVCEGDDDYAYCEDDFIKVFHPTCAGCGHPIEGGEPRIDAMDKPWHQSCFKCPKCPEPFGMLGFFPGKDGKPYCEKHYYESLGLLCDACQMPILNGKRIRMGDKSYHPEHFCCERCKKHLPGLIYKGRQGKPYCIGCFTTLFG